MTFTTPTYLVKRYKSKPLPIRCKLPHEDVFFETLAIPSAEGVYSSKQIINGSARARDRPNQQSADGRELCTFDRVLTVTSRSANQQSRLQPMAGARSRLELEFQQSPYHIAFKRLCSVFLLNSLNTIFKGRKFSQPTATISKGGMASLLRSLSISSRPGLVPPGAPAPPPPPPPAQSGLGDCEGAGEGLSLSPPHASAMTPVIADQASLHSPPPSSVPSSPSTAYAEARSRIDAIFSNVETTPLRRGLRGCRAESPPPTIESLSSVERMDSGGGMGGGAGNTSTFRRRRPQQQGQSQQRTAGINLMRGSMFQLNTTSTSVASTAGGTPSMDMDMCYGYDSKQAPMTPGPGRRAPLRTQLSTSNESGQVIRPPRRSSSVCRELPGLCQQQQFLPQPQQQQHFFPPTGHLPQMDQQQPLNSNSHYAAPRGTQQHPQRVYADPRSFQQQQQQNGAPIAAVGTTATTAAAAQLAVEAVAARRHQQYGSSSGLRNSVTQRTISPTQNGLTQSRLPQRQSIANTSSNSNTGVGARTKNPRAFYDQQKQQQQLPQTGIPSVTGSSFYSYPTHQYAHQQQRQHHHNQQNLNYPLLHQQQQQLQQQMHQDYPPPPAAFDDIESTSFIEPPPPPPPPPPQ
ncbi:hypothetical protein EGR_03522 [Echinococcus granulosus]|uniref:Uncharacterized protein n=1 Tax=Echinococcus granulosus TaxID=6210 RepID=W6UKV0_ECHGR|nr:hypothetical protein EGR_03522 [Echinococcus granulosus]EUB61708.1 hypothetical protein EGR_03522 [Echinococcus granulosus]